MPRCGKVVVRGPRDGKKIWMMYDVIFRLRIWPKVYMGSPIDKKPNLTKTSPSLRRNNSKAIDSRFLQPTRFLNISNRFLNFRRPSLAPPDPQKLKKTRFFQFLSVRWGK